MAKKETRGRKPIDPKDKKVQISIYVPNSTITKMGGKKSAQDKLYQFTKSYHEQTTTTI
jgi:hypothetical protein